VGARPPLQELVTTHGRDEVLAYAGHLCDYSERITRAAIAAWPDGVYTFADVLEVIEGDQLTLAPLRVTATIAGDGVTF
jgi:N-methylhydantoinase B